MQGELVSETWEFLEASVEGSPLVPVERPCYLATVPPVFWGGRGRCSSGFQSQAVDNWAEVTAAH